jgi:hypothetical protein
MRDVTRDALERAPASAAAGDVFIADRRDRSPGGTTAWAACPCLVLEDELLADVLVRMWALASGRRPRPGVRPEQMSEEELISFWADDLTPVTGRHASPEAIS